MVVCLEGVAFLYFAKQIDQLDQAIPGDDRARIRVNAYDTSNSHIFYHHDLYEGEVENTQVIVFEDPDEPECRRPLVFKPDLPDPLRTIEYQARLPSSLTTRGSLIEAHDVAYGHALYFGLIANLLCSHGVPKRSVRGKRTSQGSTKPLPPRFTVVVWW